MENQLNIKWYQKPVTVILFLIFFFPVGLYLMWKHDLWNKTTRVIVSVFFGLLLVVNMNKNNNNSNSENLKIKEKVTRSEAQSFMKSRLLSVNQTLMDVKTSKFNGKTLYLFLSVAEDGSVCISTVSEFALEVLASDCGDVYSKTEQWNNL